MLGISVDGCSGRRKRTIIHAYVPALLLAGSFMLAPTRLDANVISVNGICEVGTCGSPDVMAPGTTTSGNYSFVFALPNTDSYSFVGSFATTTNSIGQITNSSNILTVTYLGNPIGSASQTDVLTFDSTQWWTSSLTSITDSFTTHGTFAGALGAGTSVLDQVFIEGNSDGILGPFTPPAGWNAGPKTGTFSGLTDPLDRQVELTLTFGGGSAVGAIINVNPIPTPEPGSFFLLTGGFLTIAIIPLSRWLQSNRNGRNS